MLSIKKDKLKKLVGQSQRWSIPFQRKGLSTAGASAPVCVTHGPEGLSTRGIPCGQVSYAHGRATSHGVGRLFGCLVVHSTGMRVPGCLAVCPCARCQGVAPVKTQFSKGATPPPPVRHVPAVPSRKPARNWSHKVGLSVLVGAISHRRAKALFLEKPSMKQKILRLAALSAPLFAAGAARAADPATALDAVQSLSTSSAGFGPVMFGLAVASVGIAIGVKWIKRSKNAA